MRRGAALLATLLALPTCDDQPPGREAPNEQTRFHRSDSLRLVDGDLEGASMDALALDVDGDGDLDIVVAQEFAPNVLLVNEGGQLRDRSETWLPRAGRDSEDIGVGDLDADGRPDLVIVSEDDQVNEIYLARDGVFEAAGGRLPVQGTSNAVVVADLTGDGLDDIVIGNNGQNTFSTQTGDGFVDETVVRLPERIDVTQDLELGDIDGDGDCDLVVANEDANRILVNDGSGTFTDETAERLPPRATPEETREARLADVDGDGDLDLHFSNVVAFVPGADPANRLLINDGRGVFTDESAARLPPDSLSTFSALFADLDRDGDADLVTGNSRVDLSQGRIDPAPWRVLTNDGTGHFSVDRSALPSGTEGIGFAIVFADLDGDGKGDLYLASRNSADLVLRAR